MNIKIALTNLSMSLLVDLNVFKLSEFSLGDTDVTEGKRHTSLMDFFKLYFCCVLNEVAKLIHHFIKNKT